MDLKPKNYDLKIGGKKLLKNIVHCFIAGAAIVFADNPYYIALLPLTKMLENMWNHW